MWLIWEIKYITFCYIALVCLLFILGKCSRFLCAIQLGHRKKWRLLSPISLLGHESVFSVLNLYLDSVSRLSCLLLLLLCCHCDKKLFEIFWGKGNTFSFSMWSTGFVFVVFTYLSFSAELFLNQRVLQCLLNYLKVFKCRILNLTCVCIHRHFTLH